MITTKINPIGNIYNAADMLVDTVEEVIGVKLETDNTGELMIIENGHMYNDGIIVGVFVHPESDAIWIVVECNKVFFEVTFDGFKNYTTYYCRTYVPYKHIKDSTELSGGHLW